MRLVLLLMVCVAVVGCDRPTAQPVLAQAPTSRYTVSQTTQGAFLLDTQSGDVWRYDPVKEVFVKIEKAEGSSQCYNPETKKIEKCTPEWHKKYDKDPLGILIERDSKGAIKSVK